MRHQPRWHGRLAEGWLGSGGRGLAVATVAASTEREASYPVEEAQPHIRYSLMFLPIGKPKPKPPCSSPDVTDRYWADWW
jgi:hypothetical protein